MTDLYESLFPCDRFGLGDQYHGVVPGCQGVPPGFLRGILQGWNNCIRVVIGAYCVPVFHPIEDIHIGEGVFQSRVTSKIVVRGRTTVGMKS